MRMDPHETREWTESKEPKYSRSYMAYLKKEQMLKDAKPAKPDDSAVPPKEQDQKKADADNDEKTKKKGTA